jgi:hypothetical protein
MERGWKLEDGRWNIPTNEIAANFLIQSIFLLSNAGFV